MLVIKLTKNDGIRTVMRFLKVSVLDFLTLKITTTVTANYAKIYSIDILCNCTATE